MKTHDTNLRVKVYITFIFADFQPIINTRTVSGTLISLTVSNTKIKYILYKYVHNFST